MQFVDLKAQYARLAPSINKRINRVLEHGGYIMGPEIKELETALADFCGAKHAISCSNGTEALYMVLLAWGIGPGDAVFVPPFTFFSTAEVVSLLGATPVFVDIDPDTYNISAKELDLAVQAVMQGDNTLHPLPFIGEQDCLKPKAVIPVDLFGLPADYDALLPVAEKHGLLVLEDAAQSFGGALHGRRCGNLGCHAASTSFFPAKPLGCYGDGGAIFTNDDALAELLRSIRVHGKGVNKYENVRIGVNGRLDTIQAAILLSKLEIFEDELIARQGVAERYSTVFMGEPKITIPKIPNGFISAWAQYTIRVSQRDTLAANLKKQGIPSNIYYPKPLHCQAVYEQLGYRAQDFPISMTASEEVLSLPMHPYFKEHEQDSVIKATLAVVR